MNLKECRVITTSVTLRKKNRYRLWSGRPALRPVAEDARPIKDIPTQGTGAGRILYMNHYGWFRKKERGVYEVSRNGLRALESFKEVVNSIDIKPDGVSDGEG